jgi:Fibronectin type III domain
MRKICILFAMMGTLFFAVGVKAQGTASVTLAWTPSTSSNVAGYDIYYGTSSGNYISAVVVPANATSITIRGLNSGTTYYFAAASFDNSGDVSSDSPEISAVAGSSVAALLTPATQSSPGQYGFNITGIPGSQYIVQASTDLVHWVSVQTNVSPFNFVDSNASQYPQRFYRTAYVSQ